MALKKTHAMLSKIEAYWFAASDTLPHGDGRKIVVGETHSIDGGEIECCRRGLHGSEHPFDAMRYAPGPYLYRVEHWGDIDRRTDKLASRHRRYLAKIDATDLLRCFAREQAASVLHLWEAPQVVKDYLTTGDENLHAAAYDAATRAAAAVARDAADAAAAAADAAAAAARAAASARAAARRRFAEIVKRAFQ